MKIRKGAPKAVMALAHHMITVVHQVLSRKEEYVEFGADFYDQRDKTKTVARLVARLERLGYDVDVKPQRALPADAAPQEAGTDGQPLQPKPETRLQPKPETPKKRKGHPCKCIERGIICKHRPSIEANP